jgi:integral membrane protein
MNIRTHLGRFRFVALLEGISFLILLFVAYGYRIPEAVRVVGMAHGLLFMAYMLLLIVVKVDQKWPLGLFVKSALVSLVPFGTFYADAKWWNPTKSL